MSNQRSVGKFCSIVVTNLSGTSDSISSLVGTVLGEGAEAWCVATAAPFRWTSATITPDSVYFVAASGGGTWVRQVGAAGVPEDSSVAMTTAGQSAGFIASVQNEWNAMQTASFAYAEELYAGPNWSLNTTNGVRTYNGIPGGPSPRAFMVTCSFTVIPSGAAALFEFDIDLNGGRIGGTAGGSITSQVANLPNGSSVSITQSCNFFASPGDTWQHIWRITSASPPILTFQRFNSTFQAL
jgi:hypothetical protein